MISISLYVILYKEGGSKVKYIAVFLLGVVVGMCLIVLVSYFTVRKEIKDEG